MFWTFGKKARERKTQADTVYDTAARQALRPVFYLEYGVPDTLDGRFEMTSLHIILAMQGMDRKLSQALFDRFFVGVDRSLREMGIGDLSVPRHMKRMMTAFNGRRVAYEAALKSAVDTALMDAVKRNVYGTVERPDEAHIQSMTAYVRRAAVSIKEAA